MRDDWRAAIARVWCAEVESGKERFLGSAILVGSKHLLTCKHVPAAGIGPWFVSGPAWTGRHRVKEIFSHATRDIAILELSDDIDLVAEPLPVWPTDTTPPIAEREVILGGYTSSNGSLETPPVSLRSYDGTLNTWVFHTTISKGMSGGAAVLDGFVVGVIQARDSDSGKSYVIPIADFIDLLRAKSPSIKESRRQDNFANTAPSAPPHFVGRLDVTTQVISHLCSPRSRQILALRGAGGIGKTTIARACCWDSVLQERFPDGIFWLTLGQTPDLLGGVQTLLAHFSSDLARYPTLSLASAQLRQALIDKACLIVLDDVWSSDDLKPFLVAGRSCSTLVTTRERSVSDDIQAKELEVGLLSPEACVEYLTLRLSSSRGAPIRSGQMEHLSYLVEFLPLALTICATHLQDGMPIDVLISELSQEIVRLRALELNVFSSQGKSQCSLDATLNLSLRKVAESELITFLLLGLLKPQAEITPLISAALSRRTNFDTQRSLAYLCSKSLLLPIRNADGNTPTYRLHSLLRDKCHAVLYGNSPDASGIKAPLRFSTPREAHQFVLDGLRVLVEADEFGQASWSRLARADSYIGRNLFYHLKGAGQLSMMFEILQEESLSSDGSSVLNDWMATQELLGQPNQFLADCDLAWELAEDDARATLAFPSEGRLTIKTVLNVGRCIYGASVISSVTGRNSKISLALARKLLEFEVWQPLQALFAIGRAYTPAKLVPFVSELPEPAKTAGLALVLTRLRQNARQATDPETARDILIDAHFAFTGFARERTRALLAEVIREKWPASRVAMPPDDDLMSLRMSARDDLALSYEMSMLAVDSILKRIAAVLTRPALEIAQTASIGELAATLSEILEWHLWTFGSVHPRDAEAMSILKAAGEEAQRSVLACCQAGRTSLVPALDEKRRQGIVALSWKEFRRTVSPHHQDEEHQAHSNQNLSKEHAIARKTATRAMVHCVRVCEDDQARHLFREIVIHELDAWRDNARTLVTLLADHQRAGFLEFVDAVVIGADKYVFFFDIARTSLSDDLKRQLFGRALAKLRLATAQDAQQVVLEIAEKALGHLEGEALSFFFAVSRRTEI